MEGKKKTQFLLVLLHLVQICTVKSQNCPRHPDKNLSCYNDFNRNITCVWNSSSVSDHRDEGCRLNAYYSSTYLKYNVSCDLKPFDSSKPALKMCSLIFTKTYVIPASRWKQPELTMEWMIRICQNQKKKTIKKSFLRKICHKCPTKAKCVPFQFSTSCVFTMSLSCIPETIPYNPACHIKVNGPGKPYITNSKVAWLTQVEEHLKISLYDSQLEWKHQDQSWSDPSVQRKEISCKLDCAVELDPDLLVQGETYEARVRVKAKLSVYEGIWSDWSCTESWVSHVGRNKPPSGTAVGIVNMSLAVLAVSGLLLAAIFFRMHKSTWVPIVKKIIHPPIPNPAKLAHLQTWINPDLEAFYSFLKPVEIVSVEATSTVDALTYHEADVKMMPENYNHYCTSFSSPSYSELCSSSTVSSFTIEPCAIEGTCGPVRSPVEEKITEQCNDAAAEKDVEIMKMIVNGNHNSEAVKVILDYEKVEKLPLERLRLHSVDSGMSNCEEVSQESMEVDSINMTDGHDEGTQSEAEKQRGDGLKVDVQKLFGSSGNILGQNSIQVCFDYTKVPKLQTERPERPNLDSCVSSSGEEHESQEERVGDKDLSSHFLSPTHSSGDLKYSSSSHPLNFSESSLGSFLPPLPSNNILEKIALMPNSVQVEPCGDGYKSVRQEQN